MPSVGSTTISLFWETENLQGRTSIDPPWQQKNRRPQNAVIESQILLGNRCHVMSCELALVIGRAPATNPGALRARIRAGLPKISRPPRKSLIDMYFAVHPSHAGAPISTSTLPPPAAGVRTRIGNRRRSGDGERSRSPYCDTSTQAAARLRELSERSALGRRCD
jgi:hypothetical protein